MRGRYLIIMLLTVVSGMVVGWKAFVWSMMSQLMNEKRRRAYFSDVPTSKKFCEVALTLLMRMSWHCEWGMSLRSSRLKNCVHGRMTRKEVHVPVRLSRVTCS